MNLIIDVGNSRIKLAVFDNEQLVFKKTCNQKEIVEMLLEIKETNPSVKKAIISSVGFISKTDLKKIQSLFQLFILDETINLPFINLYKTPKTLGVDRMALVSAAVKQFPKKNILIIDAGTCITYDFLSKKNVYNGGAISPGITMRYKALNTFTVNLPLLEKKSIKKITGTTTKKSIHSGVIFGVLNEINGAINDYKQKYKDLTVILTGGDAHFLQDHLKNGIFANSNFLLEGLNYILETNKIHD